MSTYVPSEAEVEAAARLTRCWECTANVGYNCVPINKVDTSVRGGGMHTKRLDHARAALIAAHAVAPREDVAEQIIQAIEVEAASSAGRYPQPYYDGLQDGQIVARNFITTTPTTDDRNRA